MSSTTPRDAPRDGQDSPSSPATTDSAAAQASLMLVAELKKSRMKEGQALERYQDWEEWHTNHRLGVLDMLQENGRIQELGKDNDRATKALVKYSVELKQSSEKAQQALEEYQAIVKETLKGEREVLEVFLKLNGIAVPIERKDQSAKAEYQTEESPNHGDVKKQEPTSQKTPMPKQPVTKEEKGVDNRKQEVMGNNPDTTATRKELLRNIKETLDSLISVLKTADEDRPCYAEYEDY